MASCEEYATARKVQDYRSVEIKASNALKNIQTLYTEIMCPSPINDDHQQIYISDEDSIEKSSTLSQPSKSDKRSVLCKQCDSKYDKICGSCMKLIRCDSCNTLPPKKFVNSQNERCLVERRKIPHVDRDIHPYSHKHGQNIHNDIHNTENATSRVTIPQPFAQTLTDEQRKEKKRLKLNKIKEEMNEAIDKELKVKIYTNPVPKHTYLPLYQNIVEENERKKRERKENLQEKLKTIFKPFHLSSSKSNLVRAKSTSDLTSNEVTKPFKAKPVPKNILSSKVSEKLKNQEAVRKILIVERAAEKLKESSLPFSKKKVSRSFSMINLNTYNQKECVDEKQAKRNRDIAKNLYNNKCKETMENWNKKVLLMNPPKLTLEKTNGNKELNNYINRSKQFSSSQSLSLFNLPVRMSNAAMLREKQIRTDLFARKWREDQAKINEEEKIQKEKEIKRNIWPKLHSMDPTSNSSKIIEEKIKKYRSSQIVREQEYAKELQEIMERVGKQLLLIERQTKDIKNGLLSKADSIEDNDTSSRSPNPESDEETSKNEDEPNDGTFSISSS